MNCIRLKNWNFYYNLHFFFFWNSSIFARFCFLYLFVSLPLLHQSFTPPSSVFTSSSWLTLLLLLMFLRNDLLLCQLFISLILTTLKFVTAQKMHWLRNTKKKRFRTFKSSKLPSMSLSFSSVGNPLFRLFKSRLHKFTNICLFSLFCFFFFIFF